jgi:Flp pilus assembly CpaF family ATPase
MLPTRIQSLTGMNRSVLNSEVRSVRLYGSWIQDKLSADRTILDFVVNPDGKCWINRLGRGFEFEQEVNQAEIELLLNAIATARNVERFDHDQPILETTFPLTGDRISGLIAPVVAGPSFALRTKPGRVLTTASFAEDRILTGKSDPLNARRHADRFCEMVKHCDHLQVLRQATVYRRNLLLAGPTGSGKTALANAIMGDWAVMTPGDRVVTIEDTPELTCAVPNNVQLLSNGNISQADLLVASLRLIPKRLVVGEVRNPRSAQVLLEAWNTGHSGGLATLHANDCLNALRRLETLLGGHTPAIRERIADAINLVVFIDAEEGLPAGRKVREVMLVKSLDRDTGDYSTEWL